MRIVSHDEMRQDYFLWLCRSMQAVQPSNPYYCVMKMLHIYRFSPIMELDKNRSSDGLALREQFIRMNLYSDNPEVDVAMEELGECSMLEMMVGVANRMHDQLGGSPHIWFWEIMENLGLTQLDDKEFNRFHGRDRVNKVIDNINNRTFDANGVGGMFPLESPDEDQRDVEIWYQMNTYILENYDVA